MNKIRIFALVMVLLTGVDLFGYDKPLVSETGDSWQYVGDLRSMPQHLFLAPYREGQVYTLYYDHTASPYRRPFDAARVAVYGGRLITFRKLDSRTVLYAAIDFKNEYFSQRTRSLEKSFYNSLVSITDSTTGNFQYNGPLVDFALSKQFTNKLNWSFQVNYGVEKGLKDVYSKAETRELNVDFITALRYQMLSAAAVDIWGRRLHSLCHYEMVKEYSSAEIETWYGETMYRYEINSSSVDVLTNHDGYEFGGGLRLSPVTSHWQAYLSGNTGVEINAMNQGSSSATSDRGYWRKDASDYLIWAKHQGSALGMAFFVRYQNSFEWGRTGIYQATFAENTVTNASAGMDLQMMNSASIMTDISARFNQLNYDYINYLDILTHTQDEIGYRVAGQFRYAPYPIIAYSGTLAAERIPLDFYYPDDYIDNYSAELGFEYQRNLIRILLSVKTGVEIAPSDDGDLNQFIEFRIGVKQ